MLWMVNTVFIARAIPLRRSSKRSSSGNSAACQSCPCTTSARISAMRMTSTTALQKNTKRASLSS